MKNTNYKGKTNEELASEFLDSMVKKKDKTARHFRILLTKYKAWEKEGVADLVNKTIERVYDTILKNGFAEGYFQAYFETALENNLLQQLNQNKKKISYVSTFEYSHYKTEAEETEAEEELAEYERLQIEKMLFGFNQLADSGKEVLTMLLDEQRYRETQKALGLTIGQVKMRTRKARLQIAEYQALYPVKTWEEIREAPRHSVSRVGQIRDDITGTILRKKQKDKGYQYVLLPSQETGKLTQHLVHELVYRYHGDEHELPGYVYHINGKTKDNHIDNLLFDCY